MTLLQALHMLAAGIVLAEALNKLERADVWAGRTGAQRLRALAWLIAPWLWSRDRVVTALKASGWALLAVGSAGALASPLLSLAAPTFQDAAVLGGFAVLIVRSRVKEG